MSYNTTFGIVILSSLLACAVTTIGILVITQYAKWGVDNAVSFMGFAAVVLVSVSFIHIIPKSIEMSNSVPFYLLAGFLVLYLFNRFLLLLSLKDDV